MISFILFWVLLAGLLASWELVLFEPAHVFIWLVLCLGASSSLAWFSTRSDERWKNSLADQIVIILFCVGVFWWLLWLDFLWLKFIIPFVIWCFFVYFIRGSFGSGSISKKVRLVLFFAGTYLWSTISFGLLSVLGWSLWQVLLIFLISFALLVWPSMRFVAEDSLKKIKAYLLLILLSVEMFVVVAWLPFTEVTLALILTIFVLFIYDLEKYYLNPDLIRTRIIARKIFVYLFFLALVLLSTPWY